MHALAHLGIGLGHDRLLEVGPLEIGLGHDGPRQVETRRILPAVFFVIGYNYIYLNTYTWLVVGFGIQNYKYICTWLWLVWGRCVCVCSSSGLVLCTCVYKCGVGERSKPAASFPLVSVWSVGGPD